LKGHIEEVLSALGIGEMIGGLDETDIAPMLAGIRADVLTGAKAVTDLVYAPGWSHAEAALLQSAGDASAGFPALLKARIASQLDGLAERLAAPGAAFLDVGVGVGALSIAMVRHWPLLRIVGIDPWAPSVAIARGNVERAGLSERIEIREVAGEDLTEIDSFDLAWIPSLFIPQQTIARIVECVARAVRPGGWLLLPIVNPSDDTLTAATARLRTTLWGGSLLDPSAAKTLLTTAKLGDVRVLPATPAATIAITVGRRLPAPSTSWCA
jgi:2-polyprenyl-3-methyl-5-hydroxy-6-metoxy-1,4-benzoquinol methylase